MEFLFWDVDTQIDFLSPQGKLYVPGAEKIIPNLRRLTKYAADHTIPIVSSTDAHVQNDPEFSQYPPHCLVGTEGQKKVEETLLAEHLIVPNRLIDLPREIESRVIHRKQNTLDGQIRINAALNEVDRVQQLGYTLECVVFALKRNQQRICRRKHVEGNKT